MWHQPFSSLEAALLLVSTKNHDLRSGPTPEVCDSRTSCHSEHAQSKSDKSDWFWSQSIVFTKPFKPEFRWTWPEVTILGADQKGCGLWGRGWVPTCFQSTAQIKCEEFSLLWDGLSFQTLLSLFCSLWPLVKSSRNSSLRDCCVTIQQTSSGVDTTSFPGSLIFPKG